MGKVVEIQSDTKKKRRRPKKKWPWITAGVIVLVIILIHCGLFTVKYPKIEGNERVSDAIVMENLDMHSNMNLIYYCLGHMNSSFELDPLILSADVFIEWPRNIRVVVTEKKVMGYIPYMGMYLCIDTTGSVLDSIHEVPQGTPLLTGVSVRSFALGEAVNTDDTERFTIMLDCLNVLEKYELLDQTKEVSVARADDIHLKYTDLDVSIGTTDDLDRKVAALVSILADEDRPAGVLHLEDLDGQVYIESNNSVTNP